jgi:iron(III) transport system substrate-binding protein
MRRLTIALLVAALLAGTAAVSTSAGPKEQAQASATTLTVYSGRAESFVKPAFDKFTELTGIELRVRYGDSAELAATLLEEGSNSPADLFFSQDAGALGVVASRGRLAVLPEGTLRRVPRRFRAPGKRWVGVSGRARVVAYNTDALTPSALPKTIWGYTQPRWRGLVGLPPTNASFQAFVSAMRIRVGENRTRDWLLALKANDVRFYTSNARVVSAVANREIQVGFVNHYYVYQHRELRPDDPVANNFLGRKDPGALINVAGIGILPTSDKRREAIRLINFLLSRGMQRFFSTSPGRAEYPLIRGIRPRPGLPPLTRLEGARVSLQRLGRELPKTLELLAEVGYTR